MPRDVETLLPPPQAPAVQLADIGGVRDGGLLALLGVFTMVDAVLVVLWGMM